MGLGFGVCLGILGMVIGQWISGGSALALMQPVALGMVLIGTFAGVLVSFPRSEFKAGVARLFSSLRDVTLDFTVLQQEVALVAGMARKDGFLALDNLRPTLKTPGLKEGVKYLMDGFDGGQIRELFDTQIRMAKDRAALPSRLWEAAGAYAPTMGVIAATLGLMRVMANFEDMAKLGSGISEAFVALIYGILFANLLFLPFANRIRRNAETEGQPLQMVKAAILSIQEGINPSLIEEKMKQMLPKGSA